MHYSELLAVVTWLLEREQRISYRFLRREFGLDEDILDDLRFELVRARQIATEEDGEILIWIGDRGAQPEVSGRAPPTALETTPAKPEAERRQLTVMFCDLVGSTALSTRLDPEDLREVITAFQNKCREAVDSYAGFIARYMGDGMLVYFGYPRAHEDDAERAVRAGLDIVRSMAELNAEIDERDEIELAVRIGVATGPVVVGDIVGEGAAEEAAVVGETPNLAARLQGVAQPNQVVVASVTRQMLGASFEYEDLGVHELKGIARPVQVWRAVGEVDAGTRMEAERVASDLPLVGRQEELGLLVRSWEASKEGHGQVVLIQGEAGIGKSRLLEALREHVAGDEHVRVAIRCSPYHSNSMLYPVTEHLKRVMGWQPDDSNESKLQKLEAALGAQSTPLEEAVPLYAELMSLPLPEGCYPPLELTAEQQREQTLDALSGWILDEAERTPVFHAWEDLHWADPTTLELVGLYIEQSPTVSMLNVLTYRPDFVAPWSMHSHMTPITLNRLERVEVEGLINYQARGKSVPEEVVEHIVQKADGVPLYVEELTKTMLGSDYLQEEEDCYTLAGSLAEVSIPTTLQDSLMARLDHLPALREVAQLGSVLGREFAYDMLQSIAPHKEPILQDGLGQLVENELLYQRGRGKRARYIFKHALIQDAAYQSLLKRTRQQYHKQVAELIENKLPDTAAVQPELLARHYSEAGEFAQAVEHWRTAGRVAAERSANAESIMHFRHALEDIQQLPETPERAREELDVQKSLGPALIASMGYGAQDVQQTYTRARDLCDQIGSEPPDRFPVLRGLWNSYLFAAQLDEARERGAELLQLAEDVADPALIVEACRVMGTVSFVRGDFVDAQRYTERVGGLYDPEQHRNLALIYGADPAVVCGLYGAKAQWMLGFPERAEATMGDALARVRDLRHGHTEAFALCYRGALAQYRRDIPLVLDSVKAAVTVASEHGIRQWLAWATILWGWALVLGGEHEEGIVRLQEGSAKWRITDRFALPYLLGLNAEALAVAGQVEEALDEFTQAVTLSDQQHQRFYLSELHRLKGGLLLELERGTEAEKNLRRSVEVAREQQAKSLELRAALDLGKLWQSQGKRKAARKVISEARDGFTEGLDTPDLCEANSVLEELS